MRAFFHVLLRELRLRSRRASKDKPHGANTSGDRCERGAPSARARGGAGGRHSSFPSLCLGKEGVWEGRVGHLLVREVIRLPELAHVARRRGSEPRGKPRRQRERRLQMRGNYKIAATFTAGKPWRTLGEGALPTRSSCGLVDLAGAACAEPWRAASDSRQLTRA